MLKYIWIMLVLTMVKLELDSYQVAANIIGIVQVVFIGVYYGSYGQPESKFVSDLLFEIAPYKVLMTVFVVMQCIFCFMFIFRLLHTFTLLFWIQTVSIIACVAGWITLNTKYLSPDGKTSDTHRYGTLVFMIGMISYFACLLYCIKSFLINISRDVIGTMIAYLIAVLLVVTFVLGILFIVGLFNSESNAWMFEHSAFMTIVLAHIAFFSLESPDPWLPFSIEDPQYQRIQETETSGLNPRIAPSDLPRMSVKGV